MTAQTPTTEAIPKRKQQQPKHHAGKSRAVASARRRKIVQGVLEGKPLKQIGIEVGLSPKTADNQVTKILREPHTKNALLEAMEKAGLNDEELARQHCALMNASRYLPARGDDVGSPEAQGYIAVPDYQAKAKALEMFHKLTGSYVDRHEVDMKQPVTIVIRKFCSRGNPSQEGAKA